MNENWLYALGEGWLKAGVLAVIAAVGAWVARRPIEEAGVKQAANDAVKSLLSAQDTALKRQDSVLQSISTALDNCERERRDDREHFEGRIDLLRGEIAELKQLSFSVVRQGEKP